LSQLTVEAWQQTKAGRQTLSRPTAAEGGWRSQPLQRLLPHSAANATSNAIQTAGKNLERGTKKALAKTWGVHVTVMVPDELREVLRANQRDGYAALMRATAEAIIELARDRRHVGGTVGVMAVLHAWTQQLVQNPHSRYRALSSP
jgi:hypothetical protein